MRWVALLSLFILAACNSKEPGLTSLAGISNPSSTTPAITNFSISPFRTYGTGETLSFVLTYSKPVTVDGVPRVKIQTDLGVRYANYVSGSGSDTLLFSYVIGNDTSDSDGIILSQSIDLNGGSIYDSVLDEDSLISFVSPSTSGILINASTATIVSITPPANGVYSAGQSLRFIVNFSEKVCVTNIPRLAIKINSTNRLASYVPEACSTSLKFDYIIAAGEADADGVETTNVSLDLTVGPAAIKDVFSDNASVGYTASVYAGVTVTAANAPPVELARTVPPDSTYIIGSIVELNLNFNEVVNVAGGTPHIPVTIGGTSRNFLYLGGSGTASLVFRYVIQEGDLDTDGITIGSLQYNGSSIKDIGGANATLTQSWPSTANVKVDGIRPTIVSVTSPANKIYRPGENLDFVVTWSEHVGFTGPTPYISISLDSSSTPKQAASHSNDGYTTTYRYTIQNGDADFNGIVVPSATLTLPAGGSVIDDRGNSAVLTFTPVGTSSVFVAPLGMDHWYDPTNSGTFGSSAGTTLMQFKDMIGNKDGLITGSPGWNGSPKRVDFTSATDIHFGSNFNNFQFVVLVLTTKGTSPGQIMVDGNNTEVFLQVGGPYTVGSNCGNCAEYFNGTNWVQTNANGSFGGGAGLNQKKIIMLKYNGQSNVNLYLNSDNGWYLNELFIMNGSGVSGQAAELFRAISMKHSTAGTP